MLVCISVRLTVLVLASLEGSSQHAPVPFMQGIETASHVHPAPSGCIHNHIAIAVLNRLYSALQKLFDGICYLSLDLLQ